MSSRPTIRSKGAHERRSNFLLLAFSAGKRDLGEEWSHDMLIKRFPFFISSIKSDLDNVHYYCQKGRFQIKSNAPPSYAGNCPPLLIPNGAIEGSNGKDSQSSAAISFSEGI